MAPWSSSVQMCISAKQPSCSFGNFKQHVEMHLKPLIDNHKDLLLLGDFNFNLFAGHFEFLNFFEKCFNCKQIVTKATHDTGSQLDLIFTNISPCTTDVIEAYWSDHKMIYCTFEWCKLLLKRTGHQSENSSEGVSKLLPPPSLHLSP